MATLSDLIVKLGIDATNFTGPIDTALGKLDSLGGSALKLGGILTASVTVPLTGLGIAAFKAADDFDQASDRIRAGTGATGDALKGLEVSFKSVFEDVPASSEQVSTAIADLNTRLGLTGPPLEALSTQMLNLARITKTEVGPLIADTTRVFGDWGIATDDQSDALDYLFKVSQSTGVGINSLSQQVVQFGAPLRQMGFDFDTAAALVGKFEKEGVNAELVFGSMRIALTRMAKEGVTDAGTALQLVTEQIKNAGSAGEANAIALETFGARAGPDMAAAIREGRFSVNELVTALTASKETINSAAADTLSFGEKWQQFKNKLESALVPLGTTLINALTTVLQYSQPLIDMISGAADWFSKLDPALQTVGLAVGALAAAIGPLLLLLGGMASGLSAILGLVGGPAGLTAILGFLWPIVAGIAAAWATWELAKWLSGFEPVKAAIDFLLGGLEKLWEWILKIPGAKALVDKAGEAFDDLKGKVSNLGKAQDDTTESQKKAGKSTDDLKKKTVAFTGAVGDSKEAIDKWNKEVDRLNEVNKKAAEALAKSKTKVVELHLETVKARNEMELFSWGIIKVKGSAEAFVVEAQDMVDRIGDIERASKSLKDVAVPAFAAIAGAMPEAIKRIGMLDDAYKTLGQTSKDESDKIVAKAHEAAEAILGDPNATEFAKRTAIYKALKIQVEQAEAMGEEVPQETRDALTAMETELKTNLPAKFENPWKDSIQNVSTNITNAAQDIVGILIGTQDGSVWDALKKLGQSVLTSFTEPALAAFNKFITEGIKAAIGWLIGSGGLMEGLGAIGKKIVGLFGGANEAGEAVSGSISESVSSGIDAISQTTASAISSVLSIVTGFASAAGSIIGAIGTFRLEGTLNAIEQHTKVMAITMAGIAAPWEKVPEGQTTMSGQLWLIIEELRFGVFVKALERIRDEIVALGAGYINPSLDSIKTSLQSLVTSGFTGTTVTTVDIDSSGYLSTIAAWDLPSKIIDFQLWLDAKLTAVAQWISPTAGALVGGVAIPQVGETAPPVVQLPTAPQQSQPIGGYLSDLFKPSRQQSKEVNDGLTAISDGLQSFQSLYSQRSEALFELVSGIGARVQDQFLGLRDSIAGIGGEIVTMKEMLWRVMTESYDVLRDVTNAHLAMIQESVAVLPKMAAANANSSGNFEINIFMDGQKVYEVVVDRLGRDLNQSGQILR